MGQQLLHVGVVSVRYRGDGSIHVVVQTEDIPARATGRHLEETFHYLNGGSTGGDCGSIQVDRPKDIHGEGDGRTEVDPQTDRQTDRQNAAVTSRRQETDRRQERH